MSAHGPSRDGEAQALRPLPMTPVEIADLVARARTWRAPAWEAPTDEQRAAVARAIRQGRHERGIPGREAAREIPVGLVAWRRWEAGRTLPQPHHEAALRERGYQLPEIVRANRRGQRGTTTKEAA